MDKYTFKEVLRTISDLSSEKCLDETKLVITGKSGESFTTTPESLQECDCGWIENDKKNPTCVDVIDADNKCWRLISLTDIERIDVCWKE